MILWWQWQRKAKEYGRRGRTLEGRRRGLGGSNKYAT